MKLPQLSLRELFLWVLVCALVLGWLREYWLRIEADDHTARALIQKKIELKAMQEYYRQSAGS